jgi:hypothetical protein
VDRARAVQQRSGSASGALAEERRRLTAPALFAYGATNALAKRARGKLSVQVAKERLVSLLENGPTLENDVTVNLRALEIMDFVAERVRRALFWRSRNPGSANAGLPTNDYGTWSEENWAGSGG